MTFGAARDEGADGKASIEISYLFPYVEKPLNSKVIKSFVPELRSRTFFCVSGFLCYLYMRYGHYKHSMYISRIHIWYVTLIPFGRESPWRRELPC